MSEIKIEHKDVIQNNVKSIINKLVDFSKRTSEFTDIIIWKKSASEIIDSIEDDCIEVRKVFMDVFKEMNILYDYGVYAEWIDSADAKHQVKVFAFENERFLRNLNAFNGTILKKIDDTKPEQYDTDYLKKRACDWLDYLVKRLEENILNKLNT